MPINKPQQGFALIEVLVTAVIIAIGVSGLGILLMRVIQGTHDSSQKSQAMWMVQDYVGRIRSNVDGARRGGYEITTTAADYCDPDEDRKICASHYDGNTRKEAKVCTSDEMAEFDNWITICGINSTAYDSPSDFILNPKLSSVCTVDIPRVSTDNGSDDCVQYEVTLTWDTRLAKTSSEEDERIQQNSFRTVVELN